MSKKSHKKISQKNLSKKSLMSKKSLKKLMKIPKNIPKNYDDKNA